MLQSWSQVNGASDKLDKVVLLDQPLPSSKAAPGAAERRVGPPQTVPIHSQACGSPALQRDGVTAGSQLPQDGAGPVLGGTAALPRKSSSDSLGGTQPPPHKDNQGP